MKKAILFTALLTVLQINFFAQKSTGIPCADEALGNFGLCLAAKNFTYIMVYDQSSNIVNVYGEGNVPVGAIQSCIAKYDQERTDCSEAPVMVRIDTPGNNGKSSH